MVNGEFYLPLLTLNKTETFDFLRKEINVVPEMAAKQSKCSWTCYYRQV